MRDKCLICTSFIIRTKKQRVFDLKDHLMEEVMHPSSEVDSDRKGTDAVFMSSVPLAPLTLRPKSGEKRQSSFTAASSKCSELALSESHKWSNPTLHTERLPVSPPGLSGGLVAGTSTDRRYHRFQFLKTSVFTITESFLPSTIGSSSLALSAGLDLGAGNPDNRLGLGVPFLLFLALRLIKTYL